MTKARGFSLIEVMVVVAILGVLAALAAPNLLLEVQKASLDGAAEEVATFIARAQNEAMVSRRCVRVTFSSTTATAERFETFDCDNTPGTAPFIGASATSIIGTDKLASAKLQIIFDGTNGSVVPNECGRTTTAPGSTAGTKEIRFRPNGRIFSNNGTATSPNVNDDDAIVVVRHNGMAAANNNTRLILVNGNGLICTLDRGASAGAGPDFNCP
jgi:type IV fimbrial biogenesis protein FimT